VRELSVFTVLRNSCYHQCMNSVRSLVLFQLAVSFANEQLLESFKPQELLNGMVANRLSYPELSWRAPEFQSNSLRSAISRMQQEGLLVAELSQGKSFVRLTGAGREETLRIFPGLNPIQPKWDRTWRLLIFSHLRVQLFPTKTYRRLRTLIQQYHFARLERGVYISPFAVHEELKRALGEARVFGSCVLVETKRFIFGDELTFSSQAWNLEESAKAYSKVGKLIESMLIRLHREKTLNDAHRIQFLAILSRILPLLQSDPNLPHELFPLEKDPSSVRNELLKLASLIVEKDPARRKA